MPDLFTFIPHPRIASREAAGPPKVADVAAAPESAPWYDRFNSKLAVKITNAVGTMWCAYAFAVLAFISLPAAISTGNVQVIISWIAQTFLQLVLLSIIIVGQNVLAAASDKRAEATFEDADAVLHTSLAIQDHLAAQDEQISAILDRLQKLGAA